MIEKNVGFSGYLVGTVKKIDKKSRKVAVFLPKMMPAIPETGSKQVITNYGNTSIKVNYRNYMTSVDYIWTEARNTDEPMPEVGSKVLVWFLENSPWAGYWEKFNALGDYSVIPEERYKSLFTVKIGDKTIKLSEADELKINVPDTLKVVSIENGKEHQVNLINKNQYYTKEDISAIVNPLADKIQLLTEKIDELNAEIEKLKG